MPSEFSSAAGPPVVARLIDAFRKLPGIGPKSAQRLTYHMIRMPREEANELSEALLAVKDRIVLCEQCQNISEQSPCDICENDRRDKSRICVVEEPLDAMAIERTRAFNGLYHVLHGVISPVNGIGADDLKLRELLIRLQDGEATEVILATNPNLEGEATAMYIQRLIADTGITVTRLARGLSAGADLEYADDTTLTQALQGRSKIDG
jgi:recombination protein RecR